MLKKMLTPEVREKVKRFVWEDLNDGFDDECIFAPIVLVPEVDVVTGDEYLHIGIVFDGNQDKLDSNRTVGLRVRLVDMLDDMGIRPSFSTSYTGVDEWKYLGRRITERAGA